MSPVLLPVKNKKVFIERTEYKPLIGGPDSGIPPLFEVGSGLHSHAVLGIDIGNESARMATLRRGALIQVGRTTPSVMEEKKPERVTYEGLDCVKEGEIGFARAIKSKIGSDWSFITAGESYSAELLYSLLLESLKETAQEQLQELVSKCVLTVPLGFSSAQRALVKRAAEDAGLQVLQLLNEPAAAALQYCCNNYQRSGKFLIVSAGASSLGVMAFEYYRGIIEVKSASGDSRFGADDFDNAIAELLVERADEQNEMNVRLDGVTLERLRRAAVGVRNDLFGGQYKGQVVLENYHYDHGQSELLRNHLSSRVSIDGLQHLQSGYRNFVTGPTFRLETLINTKDYLARTQTLRQKLALHIEDCIAESGFALDDFDEILLHGGFTNNHLVQQALTDILGTCASRTYLDNQSAAVYGAAIQANLITYGLHNMVVWDVLASPIGVEREDGSFKEIVARNTPLPVRAFHQVPVMGATALAHFVQGDSHRASDNASLAEVTVNNCPPAREGALAVEIGVLVSGDGLVDFTARHCELMSSLPISVREGERRTFVSHIEDLKQMRTLTREASTERAERLARKLNLDRDLIPKTLRDLGYSPASIKSGYAIEHLLARMSRRRSRRLTLAQDPETRVS